MAKFGVQKGDKITARSPSGYDGTPGSGSFGHQTYPKSLLVTKVFDHGVRTNIGYIHNNNIISKEEK